MAYRPPHRRNQRPDSSSSGPAARDSGGDQELSGRSASDERRNTLKLHHVSGPGGSGHHVGPPSSQPPPQTQRTGAPGQDQGRHGPGAPAPRRGDKSESLEQSLWAGKTNRTRNIPSQSHSFPRRVPDLTDQTNIQLTEVTTRGSQSLPTCTTPRSQRSRTSQMGPAGLMGGLGPPQKYHPTSGASSSRRLGSPASDLKPTRRTFTPIPNEMELLASVSRSGGTEEGDALKNYDVQERLRGYIDEKIHIYHNDPEDSVDCLKNIVLLFRKLREGVLASGRLDDFTIELFEESVRYAILAHDQGQLLSALNGLVPNMYQAVDEKQEKGEDPDRTVVRVVRHIRSLSLNNGSGRKDNREFFSSLLLIYHLVHSSREVYQRTLEQLTLPPTPLLRPQPDPVEPPPDSTTASAEGSETPQEDLKTTPPPQPSKASQSSAFVSAKSQAYARAAADALAAERLDPIAFHRLVSGEVGNGKLQAPEALERLLLSWAAPRVRELAVPIFKKSYMSASIEWASLILGLERKGVEMWALANGFSIRDGILKLR